MNSEDFSNAVGQTQILTLPEVAQLLRCSKAHLSNLLNGRVPGARPLPHVSVGRRKLIAANSWSTGSTTRKQPNSGSIREMSGFIALDAGRMVIHASKAISAGQSDASQTKWKTLLVRPVARQWSTHVQGTWFVFANEQGGSRGTSGRGSPPDQCGGVWRDTAGIYVRILRAVGFLQGTPARLESLNRHDFSRADRRAFRSRTRNEDSSSDQTRGDAGSPECEGAGVYCRPTRTES
jgi:hypothetical protein